MDVYGSGEDMEAIKKQAKQDGLAITFNSGIDHLDDRIHAYRLTLKQACGSQLLQDQRI